MFFQNIQITPLCNNVTIRYSHVEKQYIWYYCLTKIWNTLHGNVDDQYFQVQDLTMLLIFLKHNGLFLKHHILVVSSYGIVTSKKQYSNRLYSNNKNYIRLELMLLQDIVIWKKNVKDTCQIHYFMKILNF